MYQEAYIENFAGGNRKRGMGELRQATEDPTRTVSFGVGFNFGILLGMLAVILYIMVVRFCYSYLVREFYWYHQ